jgi:hypothetical protein
MLNVALLGFVLHFDIATAHQARSKKHQQIATAV